MAAEGGRDRDDDGDGAAVDPGVHSRGVGGTSHCAHGGCGGGDGGGVRGAVGEVSTMKAMTRVAGPSITLMKNCCNGIATYGTGLVCLCLGELNLFLPFSRKRHGSNCLSQLQPPFQPCLHRKSKDTIQKACQH